MNDSTQYMGDLIASLLKYCDHNQSKLKLEAVSAEEIIQDIINAFTVMGDRKNVKIICDKLPVIMADRILLIPKQIQTYCFKGAKLSVILEGNKSLISPTVLLKNVNTAFTKSSFFA